MNPFNLRALSSRATSFIAPTQRRVTEVKLPTVSETQLPRDGRTVQPVTQRSSRNPLFGREPMGLCPLVIPLTEGVLVEDVSPGVNLHTRGFDLLRYLLAKSDDFPMHLTANANESSGSASPVITPVNVAGLAHALLVQINPNPNGPPISGGLLTLTYNPIFTHREGNLDTQDGTSGVATGGDTEISPMSVQFAAAALEGTQYFVVVLARQIGSRIMPCPALLQEGGAAANGIAATKTITAAFTNLPTSEHQFIVSVFSPSNPLWDKAIDLIVASQYSGIVG